MSRASTISKKVVFAIAVLLQLLSLAFMIVDRQYTLAYGEKVLLKTNTVDPRSLFSGDYVSLYYDISSIDPTKVDTDLDLATYGPGLAEGRRYSRQKEASLQKAWVTLQRTGDGEAWEAVSVTLRRPREAEGRVSIAGSMRYHNPIFDLEDGWTPRHARLVFEYGIETYYIREGAGPRLEAILRSSDAETCVEVSVDRRGKAAVRAIYVDGERIDF